MKLLRLNALAVAMVSCATLLATPSHASETEEATVKRGQFAYPAVRNHQETLDPFLHGEFGMSMNTANINHAYYERIKPDDGIDHYSSATIVDKFRWLEDYDPINPAQAKEKTQDRQRNFIGTIQEDDKPLAAETTKALQTVGEPVSSEVNNWVNAQNAITDNYIKNTPVYEQVKKNADSLKDREQTLSIVSREKYGEFRYYRHEDGYLRVEVISPDGKRTEIVNERKLSKNGKSKMRGVRVSKDGTYVAFFVRQGSADSDPWFIHVVNSKTGQLATPIINRINRTNPAMAWRDDNTLYYGAAELWRALVFSRTIGKGGKTDFNDRIEVPLEHIDGASVNSIAFEGKDKRYIIMDTWDTADSVYIKDTKTGNTYRLHNQDYFNKVFRNTIFNNNILAKLVHFDPETRDVWIVSGENDRRGEIIKTNLDNLKKREVVVPFPEGYDIFNGDSGEAYYHEEGNGYFLATYLKDGVSHVLLIDAPTGKVLKDLTPKAGAGSVTKLTGNVVSKVDEKEEDDIDLDDFEANENYVRFRFSNPTTPETDYKYSIAKDQFIDVRRFDLSPFDENAYETKVVFYTSKDGTKIPMNISYKKGIKLDGKNPTMLYGYGGYGVIYDQNFAFPASSVWLENGGVWAHAFIRGGGEYGEKWQKAAEHINRITGYDDFAAAADYLNSAGYADPEHLGIIGGSNGGLLVGAAMVRHPEKYRVAVPQVGVFDQFRHEKAGVTQYWMEEYGTPEEGRKVFDVLKSYSPIHNLKQGVCYPSTLIDTSKRDDRVVPSHSYRFAAALQDVESCGRPAFLSADEDAGHSPNTYQERNEREVMMVAFALNEMGVKSVPVIDKRPTRDEMKTDKWRKEEAIKEQKRRQSEKSQ
ncbi:MAG: prolyl oligopeptidase family serine peptidase [Acinetobacter sp.]|nr:prolyl oligopeptidase family serine peptidase [Acinetobacter sp.]